MNNMKYPILDGDSAAILNNQNTAINKNKSTIPITGSKLITQETDVCGTVEIKVNI